MTHMPASTATAAVRAGRERQGKIIDFRNRPLAPCVIRCSCRPVQHCTGTP
jgi:hypothetical protein